MNVNRQSFRKKIFYLSIFFAAALNIGCGKNYNQTDMRKESELITIKVGETVDELKSRYPEMVTVDRQPLGLSFAKMDWTKKTKGHISFEHAGKKLEINEVLGFIGTQDDQLKKEGMSGLKIISGLSTSNEINHHEARDLFFNILTDLRNKGWQSTIPVGAPRLRGKDMLTYFLESNQSTTLDANYRPTIEEWMQINNLTNWEFYAEHIFIQINFYRDNNKLDLKKPGSYIINYQIQSDLDYFKEFVSADDRDNWRQTISKELRNESIKRQVEEAELIKKGKLIDTNYKDPPLPEN